MRPDGRTGYDMYGRRASAAALAVAAISMAGAGGASAQSEEDPGAGAIEIPNVSFEYVTKLRRAGEPEVVRRQSALVAIPTPLDVDGDGGLDVIGTLTPHSTSRFTLRFQRLRSAELPISAEAVIVDPSGSLPRERIGVGFDARTSSAPATWQTTVSVGSPADGTVVDATTSVTGAAASVATIAGIFNGDAVNRTDPMGASVNYAPVPATATIAATLGDDIEVRTGASSPTTATAEAQFSEGRRKRVMRATIAELPQQVSVRYSEAGEDQRSVTYSATSPIPSLNASYTDMTGPALTAKAVVNATSLPTGMSLVEDSGRLVKFKAIGGALGSLEAGFANGEPALLNVNHPYARIKQTGTLRSVAARIDDLTTATIDANDDLSAELQLAPGARKPLRTLVELPGRTIDGTISNLPRRIKVNYSPPQATATYDSFTETIDRVDVLMTSDTALFGRVKRISGRAEKLPPSVSIGFRPQSGSGASFTATPAVGSIEASLTDGTPAPVLAAGQAGVILRDLPTGFGVTGRLFNVSGATVTHSAGNLHASLQTQPLDDGSLQVVDVDATFDTPGDAVAAPAHIVSKLSSLPNSVTIDHAPEATTYSASGPMSKLTLEATGIPGGNPNGNLNGFVRNLNAELHKIPAGFTLHHGKTVQGVDVTSGDALELIALEAWQSGAANEPIATGVNRFEVDTKSNGIHAQARIAGLTKAMMREVDGVKTLETAFDRQLTRLDVGVVAGTFNDPVALSGSIIQPPRSATLKFDTLDGRHITWDANAASRFSGQVMTDDLGVTAGFNLPTHAELCFGSGTDCGARASQTVLVRPVPGPIMKASFPTEFILVSKASEPIVGNVTLLLPPTNDKGERNGDVTGSTSNTVRISNMSIQNARLEFAYGATETKWGDPTFRWRRACSSCMSTRTVTASTSAIPPTTASAACRCTTGQRAASSPSAPSTRGSATMSKASRSTRHGT